MSDNTDKIRKLKDLPSHAEKGRMPPKTPAKPRPTPSEGQGESGTSEGAGNSSKDSK